MDRTVALVSTRPALPMDLAAAADRAKDYAAHAKAPNTLRAYRAGLAASAAAAGVSERSIMNQTGHKLRAMAGRYVREESQFLEIAAASLGLREVV